jgi:hypothetical protein
MGWTQTLASLLLTTRSPQRAKGMEESGIAVGSPAVLAGDRRASGGPETRFPPWRGAPPRSPESRFPYGGGTP